MEWTPIVDCAYDCSISIGAVGGSTATIAIQLKDYAGNDLKEVGRVTCYVTSDAAGLESDPVTSLGIGTDGILHGILDTYSYELISETDGDIDLTITGTSAADFYFHVVLPSGRVKHSAAMEFA